MSAPEDASTPEPQGDQPPARQDPQPTSLQKAKLPARINRAGAFRSGALELILTALGFLLVRREVWQLHVLVFSFPYWQERVLLPLAILDGFLTGAYSKPPTEKPTWRQRLLALPQPMFLVLYVACGALCERLNTGMIPYLQELVRILGVLLVAGGIAFRLWAKRSIAITVLEEDSSRTGGIDAAPEGDMSRTGGIHAAPSGPHKLLRYPDTTGRLISLVGLPLCFSAWLPLLALPGIIVVLKWHISQQEDARMSQLGDRYLEYRKKTWNILPRLY